MRNIYFTADTHFGWKNANRYRGFSDTEEMDEAIISDWNNTVSPKDTVYHLGDFSFRNPELYVRRLNGNIILIKGNHDKKLTNTKALDIGFTEVYANRRDIKIDDQTIILDHHPIDRWNKKHYGSWHCHGHIHDRPLRKIKNRFHIGIDEHRFPVSWEQLKLMHEEQSEDHVILAEEIDRLIEKLGRLLERK